ncbi:MAG: OmpA family protein [Desulfatitalea sp.]|nr:OmpA family protein [Desulfatitalea sp.]NNK01572.1 OmpA family protein [Desulfatitalea sp.]
MRRNIWLAMLLVFIVPAMLLTVSCAKKEMAVEEPVVQAAPEPVVQEPEPVVEEPSEEIGPSEEELREQARAAAEEAARQAALGAFTQQHILFAFDSSALTPAAQQILKIKAELMMANTGINATIEGHCDARGTEAYNIALGERRAEAAKTFLVDLGVDPRRLTTISYGEERLLELGNTEEAHEANRRCQFLID